jgi:hypothetical protein
MSVIYFGNPTSMILLWNESWKEEMLLKAYDGGESKEKGEEEEKGG